MGSPFELTREGSLGDRVIDSTEKDSKCPVQSMGTGCVPPRLSVCVVKCMGLGTQLEGTTAVLPAGQCEHLPLEDGARREKDGLILLDRGMQSAFTEARKSWRTFGSLTGSTFNSVVIQSIPDLELEGSRYDPALYQVWKPFPRVGKPVSYLLRQASSRPGTLAIGPIKSVSRNFMQFSETSCSFHAVFRNFVQFSTEPR